MHVAFHFDESRTPDEDWISPLRCIERDLLSLALNTIPLYRQHLRIRSGLPGQRHLPAEVQDVRDVAQNILLGSPVWRTIHDTESFRSLIKHPHLSAQIAEGVTLDDAVRLHSRLASRSDYLGAIQVDIESGQHWAFYSGFVPLRYRLHRSDVAVLYDSSMLPEVAGEDNRDQEWRSYLESFLVPRGARTVSFGTFGLQETVFDSRDNWQDAQRAGRMERVLGSVLSSIGDEIFLRARQIDPGIIDTFDAALLAMERQDSIEQLAQVAVSCRRLLERVADALFPATTEAKHGLELTRQKYYNRLRAYVRDHLSGPQAKTLLTNVSDVESRIKAAIELSNSGVHSTASAAGMHRLLVSLTALVFDLLLLRNIDEPASQVYDREHIQQIFGFLLGRRPDSGSSAP